MAIAPERTGIGIRRFFTRPGAHPYDALEWERRDARLTNYQDGSIAFEQLGVEFPKTWSLNATNIVAQKYFRGTPGTPEREESLKQVVDRVCDTIADWGVEGGYFVDDDEAEAFRNELKYLMVTQRAAFNSPVWFNIGVPGVPQQASACFILARRRRDGLHPQLVRGGGHDLQGRLRRRHQPVQDPLVQGAAQGRRHRLGPRQLHARRRCLRRHHQVRWQDPPRRQDGHPRRRPPRRGGVRLGQGPRGAQDPRPPGARLRHEPGRRRHGLGPVPERQQLGPGHRRVHAGRRRRRRLEPHRRHHRRGRPHRPGPRPHAPDRHRGMGVRRPRDAVRHHHQPVAHVREHRPHQRVEPLLGVHAHRQLGLQPGVDQPAAVPRPRGRRPLRHRSLRPHRRRRLHRPGDPGRPGRLPDRGDRRELPPLPPARHRLRQPRRHADGPGPALRLRRGPLHRRRHHLADDRPGVRDLGPHRLAHGPLRRLRRERRAHAPRPRAAPRRSGRDRRDARARAPPHRRPAGVGQRVRARPASPACATRRPRCWRPPAPSA